MSNESRLALIDEIHSIFERALDTDLENEDILCIFSTFTGQLMGLSTATMLPGDAEKVANNVFKWLGEGARAGERQVIVSDKAH